MNTTPNLPSRLYFSLHNFISKTQLTSFVESSQRNRAFDPTATLYCFLYQVIHGRSMKSALISFNARGLELKEKVVSLNTTALSKAKKKA